MKELSGKTYVITGATAGIGLYTLKTLAKKGAFVIGAGRNPARCEAAEKQVLKENPDADILYLTYDLSSQDEIKKLAKEIKEILDKKGKSLYCLINNAGAFLSRRCETADGIEMQLAVNFLAPFLLTHLLFPLLEKQEGARVLTISSQSHYKTFANWKNVQLKKCYISLWAYKQSKLFTVLFTRELDRRIRVKGLRAFAVDPGVVKTEIGSKHTNFISDCIWRIRRIAAVSIEKGAATAIHLAAAPDIKDGEIYWRDCKTCKSAKNSYNADYMKRVWEIGETLCNIKSEDYGI